MPTIRDHALCIRHWDFSETSQTVSLYTRDHGLLRGLAKGSRRDKGPFSGGLELLTRGEVIAITKPGRELATLTEWSLLELFPILSRNLAAHRTGLYFADLLFHFSEAEDPHPLLYDALLDALRSLDDDADARNRALLRFQWTLLVESGYTPLLESPETAPDGVLVFNPEAGGILPGNGHDGWRVRPETVDLIRRAAAAPDFAAPPDPATLDRANRLLAAYCRYLLDRELPTMTALFGRLHTR